MITVIVLRLTVYVWLDAKLCGLWPVCQLVGLPRLLLQLTQPSGASLPHSSLSGRRSVRRAPHSPDLPTACRAVATVVSLTLINAHRRAMTASPHCPSSFSEMSVYRFARYFRHGFDTDPIIVLPLEVNQNRSIIIIFILR